MVIIYDDKIIYDRTTGVLNSDDKIVNREDKIKDEGDEIDDERDEINDEGDEIDDEEHKSRYIITEISDKITNESSDNDMSNDITNNNSHEIININDTESSKLLIQKPSIVKIGLDLGLSKKIKTIWKKKKLYYCQ